MKTMDGEAVLRTMAEWVREGVPFVVATVIGSRGSSPRKVGAKMLVAADGRLEGTVGGGAVESRVIERARRLLEDPEVLRFEWDLGSEEAGGMACGGRMEFLLEPFGVHPRCVIFGAGHVGAALQGILGTLGFDRVVVDRREELLRGDRLAGAATIPGDPEVLAREMPLGPRDLCVIVNPTHQDDLGVLRALLGRKVAYIGLMASRRKKAEIWGILATEGVDAGLLDRVHCPVGLDIGAETPAEIAVAIAAEIIATLRGATPHGA
ncbi:MAG TPA: XdhC family protein [Myxococcota bacterium]|nr:XdhC family protein [Myxococcota bacterium]HQK51504.1 XdhC family protein [Myxococcota bacterium]